MDAQIIEIKVTTEDIDHYKRLDHFLIDRLPDLRRTFLKQLFEQNLVASPDQILRPSKMPTSPTNLTITLPPPAPTPAVAENIPLDILYEDEHLIIIDKPSGMVVHPAPGNSTGTLVNAILYHCPGINNVGDDIRPGIVHRLDKGTSGVMVVAKKRHIHAALADLFSAHDIQREYRCLLRGNRIPKSGTLDAPIGRHPRNRQKMAANVRLGKRAVTHYEVITHFRSFSHCKMVLETGRTHQIRIHAASLLKAPVLNDATYGNPARDRAILSPDICALLGDYEHPFLHARVLGFVHPATGERLLFKAEPSEIFQAVCQLLEKRDD